MEFWEFSREDTSFFTVLSKIKTQLLKGKKKSQLPFCRTKYSEVLNGHLNVSLIKLGKQLIFIIGGLLEAVVLGASELAVLECAPPLRKVGYLSITVS